MDEATSRIVVLRGVVRECVSGEVEKRKRSSTVRGVRGAIGFEFENVARIWGGFLFMKFCGVGDQWKCKEEAFTVIHVKLTG